ncbi:hypothetical protein MRB53_032804 [Persea americana]|uniref:Uncharacterized protein n=1 Tax=Persea americana TaxID=3435 RepID=A0ACC2KSX0_PERAE|nr:hypothetical protein MRB53_032804 [Persea americana]
MPTIYGKAKSESVALIQDRRVWSFSKAGLGVDLPAELVRSLGGMKTVPSMNGSKQWLCKMGRKSDFQRRKLELSSLMGIRLAMLEITKMGVGDGEDVRAAEEDDKVADENAMQFLCRSDAMNNRLTMNTVNEQ